MKIIKFNSVLLFLYFLCIPLYTLLNPLSIFPFVLIISILIGIPFFFRIIFLKKTIPKMQSLFLVDILLIIFILYAFINTLIKHSMGISLNLNHLYAFSFVIVFYYFVIKSSLVDSVFISNQNKLIKVINAVFIIIVITALFDFILLFNDIDLGDYIVLSKTGTPVMVGFNSRPKGFFVEPTDLAFALNSLTPLLLVNYYSKLKFKSFMITLGLYIFLTLIIRSSAGILGLSIGFFIYLMVIFLRKKALRIDKKFLKYVILISVPLLLVSILYSFFAADNGVYIGAGTRDGDYAKNYFLVIYDNMRDVFTKIFLLKDAPSVNDRISGWGLAINLFLESPSPFTGNGLGFLSSEGFAIHNLYLTILVENGLIGFILFMTILTLFFYKVLNIKSNIRYALTISYTASLIHFLSFSSFYSPIFWLLLVLICYPWKSLSDV